MDDKIMILIDSPEAVQQKQVTMWVSKNGYAFPDEHTARYDGCTHRKCQCGNVIEKGRIYCDACQSKRDHERFLAMPIKEWDEETPLCEFHTDKYFFDEGEIEDYCEDHGFMKENLSLVICEPTYASTIDPLDHYCDDLPEDGEVPDELQTAFDELNKKISEYKKPLSWYPGKFRTQLKD